MFKFDLPFQKGLDFTRSALHPPPIVRILVHTEKSKSKDQLAKLYEIASQILAQNASELIRFCNARRQEYSLNENRTERKVYTSGAVRMTHTFQDTQEYIMLDVYPELEIEKEKDQLCLMIVSADTVYAIGMDAFKEAKGFKLLYKKKLTKTNLDNDPKSGSSTVGYKQYKFEDAEYGFIISGVKFESDRLATNAKDDPIFGLINPLYFTPITPDLNISEEIVAEFSPHSIPVNGTGQTVYTAKNKISYTKSKVTTLETITYDPDYSYPYAVSKTGVRYFNFYANTGQFNGHDFYLTRNQNSYSFPTYGISHPLFLEYLMYGGYYWRGNPISPQGSAYYGTVPPNAPVSARAWDFGFPSQDYDPAPPITDFSLAFKFPVFYTGNGDRVEIEDFPLSANTQITWTWINMEFGSTIIRDTQFNLSFDGYSYSKLDQERDFGYTVGYNPQLIYRVISNYPGHGGLCYIRLRSSRRHSGWLGSLVDEDFYEAVIKGPKGKFDTLTTNPYSYPYFEPLGHVSNGKYYMTSYEYYFSYLGERKYKVMSADKDIYPELKELGLPTPEKWNLAVMDVKLSRIKKLV